MRSLDDKLLAGRFEEARAAWPTVDVAFDAFSSAVRLALSDDEVRLATLHTSDLFLALGCLASQSAAIQAFEAHTSAAIRGAIASSNDPSIDDTVQATIEKLVYGPPPAAPKLAQYTGKGALLAWVRVVALREALQGKRRAKRGREIAELADVAIVTGIPVATHEVELLRKLHAETFREAVQEALRRLEAEQRGLLRLSVVEGLTIDQLAPMLGVHRATVARRLERAREDALAHTKAILRERHGLSDSEAQSLCFALVNDVDVSIGRALGGDASP